MVVAVAPVDEEVAAVHDHARLAPRELGARRADQRRAGARAAGLGQPCPALPDPQPDRLLVDHLRKADIRALREQRVVLHQRADLRDVIGVHVLDEEHRMRIAHRDDRRQRQDRLVDRPDLQVDAAHVHFLRQRNIGPAHQGRAHVDRDQAALGAEGLQHVGFGLDRDPVLAGLGEDEVADAARGISAGIDLAAIGVPDPHEHVLGGIALQRDHLVRLEVGGNLADLLHARRERRGPRVENGKRVAGTVHLPELHVRSPTGFQRLREAAQKPHFAVHFGTRAETTHPAS